MPVRPVKYQLAIDRVDEILRRLDIAGSVTVAELAATLGVSRETVRRDLKALAGRGALEMVHGGATRRHQTEPALAQRAGEQAAEKARIARHAATLVPDGATVLVDSGSTTMALARELAKRTGLTVATNSLAVAIVMSRGGHRVHMLGGEIDANDESTMSHDTVEALQGFRFDVAFIAAGGLSLEGGLSDYSRIAAAFRARLIAVAACTWLLADSSKFGRETPYPVEGWQRIAGLVTDRRPPRDLAQLLTRAGLQIVLAR